MRGTDRPDDPRRDLARPGDREATARAQHPRQGTAERPDATFLAAARELEDEPGMLTASIGEGFPYADVPHMGMAFVAIADGDAEPRAARRETSRPTSPGRCAEQCDDWRRRRTRRSPGARDRGPAAVGAARRRRQRGRGHARRLDRLLEALIRNRVPSFLMTIWDPAAVQATATVGGRVDLDVGAQDGSTSTARPSASQGHPRGRHRTRGRTARRAAAGSPSTPRSRASLTSTAAERSCCTTKSVPAAGSGQYSALGVDPRSTGSSSPRPSYSTATATRWPAASSRSTRRGSPPQPVHFTYHHRRRPMLPFERDTTYD